MNIETACAFTGHRPSRFRFGYDEEHPACNSLRAALDIQIFTLYQSGVTSFLTGMAQGVDIWAAEMVLDMRAKGHSVQLTAVLPCESQPDRWAAEQRERYFNILTRCDEVVTLSKAYTPTCMHERNQYLVDHAGYLLAVYDGGAKGGTAYTVRYGKQQQRQITIIHPDTLEVTTI